MISVRTALDHLLDLVSPLAVEHVPLAEAFGRVLAKDVAARREQPPFAASTMDGYAVNKAEVELHAMFKVIGESAAGHRFDGRVGPGQAVRIFTGAPVPDGASFVVIQEDVDRKGNLITILDQPGGDNIRPAGGDFKIGDIIAAPKRLSSADIALLASMNVPQVPVRRKPDIALISTGDELVMPGETPGPGQIIASNTFGLKALLEDCGASVRILPIARDQKPALEAAFNFAKGADLVVTIGGASVGDHDLVAQVAQDLGMEQSFYKVAMRPGKPLMGGRMGTAAMIGLPGNPVSAMVCGHVFLKPVVERMLGLPDGTTFKTAPLREPLSKNGPREHYMRAVLTPDGIAACENQDSALLSVLAEANVLLLRPPHDPARDTGATVTYLTL
ncbi:molybdopterin molybdotransferase MoeA [Epibacterium ulvae]|uniref:molybdopterin molybdotransferase MoeA n=1 Tax=Epibacterium ulvae TaxID=1156985 RepID=UPI001BFC8C00|nr:gephyrin-like molybdotransferase Glp [Epibacterium ulvae]MBT8152453.1 molybdopterin molybdotransferase MoeA [Epibacterium ulvae]